MKTANHMAHINKYDGKTGDLLSSRDTILSKTELLEALRTLWEYIKFEYEEDCTSAYVYAKKGNEFPAYIFEISNI